jgi:hypothetical protein
MIINEGLLTHNLLIKLVTGSPSARIKEKDKGFFLEGMGRIYMFRSGGGNGISKSNRSELLRQEENALNRNLQDADYHHENQVNNIIRRYSSHVQSNELYKRLDIDAEKNRYRQEKQQIESRSAREVARINNLA